MGDAAGAAIGAGSSIVGGLIGAEGAQDAADAAIDAATKRYMQQRADLMPWMSAGIEALGTWGTSKKDIRGYKKDLAMYKEQLEALEAGKPGPAQERYDPDLLGTGAKNALLDPGATANNALKIAEIKRKMAETRRLIRKGPQGSTGLIGMIEKGPGKFVPEDQPGYKFGYQEFVEKPTMRMASATGNIRSGKNLKALSRYSQNYATGEYDKWLQRYYNKLVPYQNLATMGQNAAASAATMAPNTAGYEYGGEMNRTNALLAGMSGVNAAFQNYNAGYNQPQSPGVPTQHYGSDWYNTAYRKKHGVY